MSSNAERLRDAVKSRRDELAMNQLEVSRAGGPSNTLMTEIENARLEKLTNSTAKKLDAGLQWVPGSARRVWDKGEEPLPMPPRVEGMHRADVARLAEQIRAAEISDTTRSELLRVLREEAG